MVCCIILCVSNLLYSEAPCILCICIVKHPVSSDTCCATCILLYHCDQDNHCQVSTKVSKVSTAKCCVVWRAAITRLTYRPRTVLATFCRGGVTARPAARRSALRLFSVATYWMLGWCGGLGGRAARGGGAGVLLPQCTRFSGPRTGRGSSWCGQGSCQGSRHVTCVTLGGPRYTFERSKNKMVVWVGVIYGGSL